jgi:hypothetical protein
MNGVHFIAIITSLSDTADQRGSEQCETDGASLNYWKKSRVDRLGNLYFLDTMHRDRKSEKYVYREYDVRLPLFLFTTDR